MAPIVGIVIFALMLALLLFFKAHLEICRPNEIIVFSGRSHKLADGSEVGYTIVHHGWKMRLPVLEQAEHMDISTMTVNIHITNAYSRGNIPLNVHAIANVKICNRPGVVDNAVERFLGRGREEIRRVAKETIEGALRGVLATLTPEQVNEDRLSFVQALGDEVEEDFNKIGLQVDTLKIQSVSDDANYLDSIGRARIAELLRDAEIAESDFAREADKLIAHAQARSRVAQEKARANIQRAQNALRQYIAELNAVARSEEERATAAGDEARARAEVRLQEVRKDLERLRLHVELVLPADAEREAKTLIAQGESATIAAQGNASAEGLRLMNRALQVAGKSAEDIIIIQQIEPLLMRIAKQIEHVQIGAIQLVDGSDTEALGRIAAAYPSMVQAVLDSLGDITGIDIREVLRRPQIVDDGPRPTAGSRAPRTELSNQFKPRAFDATVRRTVETQAKAPVSPMRAARPAATQPTPPQMPGGGLTQPIRPITSETPNTTAMPSISVPETVEASENEEVPS